MPKARAGLSYVRERCVPVHPSMIRRILSQRLYTNLCVSSPIFALHLVALSLRERFATNDAPMDGNGGNLQDNSESLPPEAVPFQAPGERSNGDPFCRLG